MSEPIPKTGERVIPDDFQSREEYLVYLRHLFAYEFAEKEIKEKSFLLEVGCGEGYGANLLCQKAAKIIALDVDKDTIAHASKKYGSENCIFKVYDGVKIPYDDNTFDVAVSFQVIEHIQDDRGYLSEIYRVLKKEGLFFVATPNRTYRLRPGQKPLNEFHVREYYPEELEELLKGKFSNVNVWGIRGNEEVQQIEMERVREVFDTRFDPLGLRKLIPKSIRLAIVKVIKRITSKETKSADDKDFLKKYSLSDYYVIKDNIKESIELLGICRK